MAIDDMDDLHLRIERVTEDLRTIQQELNCAAMQAPSDPELMEALNSLSETEPIEMLRSALDQMRHFLWFYSQVMSNEPELGDKLRQAGAAKTASDEKPADRKRVPRSTLTCRRAHAAPSSGGRATPQAQLIPQNCFWLRIPAREQSS